MARTTATPTTNQLYRALKDSCVERKVLLTCMDIELPIFNKFKSSNFGSEESAFLETLDYFLKNTTCPGQELWHIVIDALETCKDFKTAQTIRTQYLPPTVEVDDHAVTVQQEEEQYNDTSGYCAFVSPATVATDEYKREQRIEYLQKMRSLIITEYNQATKNIGDSHYEVTRALETEHKDMKRALTSLKYKATQSYDKVNKDIQDLIDRTSSNHRNVQDTITRLNRGDCTGVATLQQSSSELVSIERWAQKGGKNIERFKQYIPKTCTTPTSKGPASSAWVTEELREVLILGTSRCNNIDDDDYYINMSDVRLNTTVQH